MEQGYKAFPVTEDLLEHEELNRFLENAAVALHWVGSDGTILWANAAELRLLGYGREEYIGHNITEFHVDAPVIADILSRLKKGEELRDYEARLRAKDGSFRHVAIVSNVFWNNGRFIHTRCFTRDITEEKRAAELQERLAAVVDSSDDAIISKDLNGIVHSWNRGAERIFGYTAEEAIGKPITILAVPERMDEIPHILDRIRRGERVEHYETRRRRKDGRVLTISLSVSPIRNASGQVIGASKIARDITQREFARRQEAFILKLDDATRPLTNPEEITETAATLLGEYVGADRCAYAEVADESGTFKLTGNYTRSVPSIVGSYALSDFGVEFVRSMRAGIAYVVEDAECDPRLTDVRPAYRQAQIRAVVSVPLYKSERFVAGMALHQATPRTWEPEFIELLRVVANRCWESIERARIERELRSSEEQFRTLANTIPNLAWMAHPNGDVFWYNWRWYEYTGTSPDDMRGWGWQRVHDPDRVREVVERWKASLATGEPFEMVFPLRGADGSFRPFLTRVEPVKDANGYVMRWFGTNTDVAVQQQVQDALERSNQELRRVNDDLNQFAYSASHDLQEPLRMVSIYSELLRRRFKGKLDSQGEEYLSYTIAGALRMEQLLKDLLAYTQASAVTAVPATPVNASEALDRALAGLQSAIQESGAEIIREALPCVRMHDVHLEQVFQNLIANAIKYRRDEQPKIEVAAVLRDSQWLFSVTDNGIGIDPSYGEQIFGIFKRLHTSDIYPGTGIGLAICQRLVDRAGGRIWVESRLGKGSTFFFTVPDGRAFQRC